MRETGEPAQDNVRFAGSSTNGPKQYRLLIGNWLACRARKIFPIFRKDLSKPRLENMPHLESYSLMACTFGQEMSEGREIDLLSGLPLHRDVEAHLQFTLNMIPAYTSYAAPSGSVECE